MMRARPFLLRFSPELATPKAGKHLCDGLSAALQIGPTLWLANDESSRVERLVIDGDGAGRHTQFDLCEVLDLPAGDDGGAAEIDIEGMDFDGGFLWVTGSHSRKRCKPEARKATKAIDQLARTDTDANRFVLARIPVVADAEGLPALARKSVHGDAKLHAARLRGGRKRNALVRELAKDAHFGRFIGLPGKENGFDVEGLAVRGERVFLGLRGPVLAGWAAILELRLVADGKHRLALAEVGDGDDGKVRKHFLQLGGLGIRDLCLQGDDLLVLSGPTMALDGPVTVTRWRNALRARGPSLVPREKLSQLLDVPCGVGCDHPEGMALLQPDDARAAPQLLLVYDSAAPQRRRGASGVFADLFDRVPA